MRTVLRLGLLLTMVPAAACLHDLSRPRPGDSSAIEARVPDRGPAGDVMQDCQPVPGDWVAVPPGSFAMGSPAAERCRSTDEDHHKVTLTRAFRISTTEVTQQQFFDILGENPSDNQLCGEATGHDCPVESVSWHHAAAYCNALSRHACLEPCYRCATSVEGVRCSVEERFLTGGIASCHGYRLPTEAEWEYAYRAGSSSAYSGPVDDNACESCVPDQALDPIGWYCANSQASLHPVATKTPNAWSLSDMAGNVGEWVNDIWELFYPAPVTDPHGGATGLARVTRGGSWQDVPGRLRAAARNGTTPATAVGTLGFRVARTL